MYTLSKALDLISTWVEKRFPDSQPLRPGLSYETIQQEVRDLAFELPTEIHELYLWRNGGIVPVPPEPESDLEYEDFYEFLSLQESVTVAKDWDNGWFPLFQIDGCIFFIVAPQEQQKTSSIFYNDELELPNEPQYESLTSMILYIAEALKG